VNVRAAESVCCCMKAVVRKDRSVKRIYENTKQSDIIYIDVCMYVCIYFSVTSVLII